MTEDNGMSIEASPRRRGRGRPFGATDSYPRERRYKKRPPPNVVQVLMPIIHELVAMANDQGHNRALGVAPRRDQEAVDRATAKLLAAIKSILDAQELLQCE